MHAPTDVHFVAIKCILRYFCVTIDYGIHIQPSERLSLVRYVDANWGLEFDDCRSTTDYCMYFGGNLISWCSKKQQVVSQSIVEVECQGLVAITTNITWLESLLREL
ncbi:hypothetical protein V6Z11_D02G110800 [Gossypium hirsutum]